MRPKKKTAEHSVIHLYRSAYGQDWDRYSLCPSRRPLRAEHIDTSPPQLEDLLREVWARVNPRLAANAKAVRRNRVLIPALAVILAALAVLPAVRARNIHFADQTARAALAIERARHQVDSVLDFVGHEVKVEEIRLEASEYYAAYYSGVGSAIVFNEDILDWPEPYILIVAAHECVHALFDQAGLSGYQTSLEHRIVEETAAQVLGAHLAGRVFASQGGNGHRVTQLLVSRFRRLCKNDSPESARRLYLRYLSRKGLEALDPVDVWSILNHYGNERLVDEVNDICVRFHDPLEAAQEISRRYKLFFRFNPAEIPKA